MNYCVVILYDIKCSTTFHMTVAVMRHESAYYS